MQIYKNGQFGSILKSQIYALSYNFGPWTVNKKSEECVTLHSDLLEMSYELNIKMKFLAPLLMGDFKNLLKPSRTYVTWSRGMSQMSLILILSYRLKQMSYFYVLHCFEIQGIAHISWTRCQIVMGYGSKCRIWYEKVDYIENSSDLFLLIMSHIH